MGAADAAAGGDDVSDRQTAARQPDCVRRRPPCTAPSGHWSPVVQARPPPGEKTEKTSENTPKPCTELAHQPENAAQLPFLVLPLPKWRRLRH